MSEIYFENIDKIIISYLNSTKFDLKIAVAWITDPNLLAAINSCLSRNVKVTIVFYDDKINNKDGFENLFRNGAEIHYTKNLMHNKFCIIDNQITINGSFNWTRAAKRNHENIQVNHSTLISEKFLIEFKKIITSAQNINKHFANNEKDFIAFVQKIGYPDTYPVFFKQELNKELKTLFSNINNTNIKYIYIYCEDESRYMSFQKSIYDYFYTLKKYTFNESLIASRYNCNKWYENYESDGKKSKIERTESDSIYILDLITQINPSLNFIGKEYDFTNNCYSESKFIYLKDNNFLIIGIDKEDLETLNRKNIKTDLNSLLNIKLTKPKTNEIFEDICRLSNSSIHFNNNDLIVETESYFNFDIGTTFSKSYSYQRLIFLKYPKIEIELNKTEDDKNKQHNIYKEQHSKFKENLILQQKKDSAEKSKREKEEKDKQCYIATMVYGDINHYKVEMLRKFRDEYLNKFYSGRIFIKLYYLVSPKIVENFNNKYFILFSKFFIEKLIDKIKKQ